MSLAKKFKWNFGTAIRSRGKSIFNSHKPIVINKIPSENELEATVKGSSKYTVHFAIHNEKLYGACSCPYYEECKHMWAVLLLVDTKGWLRGALGGEVSDFLKDYDDLGADSFVETSSFSSAKDKDEWQKKQDELKERFFCEERFRWYGLNNKPSLLGALDEIEAQFPNGLLVRDRKAFWDLYSLEQHGFEFGFEKYYSPELEKLLGSMSHQDDLSSHLLQAFTQQEEVLYHIDSKKCSTYEVAFQVTARKMKKNGEWGVEKNDSTAVSTAAKPVDLRILDFMNYPSHGIDQYGYYSNDTVVSGSKMTSIADLLIESGRCYVDGELLVKGEANDLEYLLQVTHQEGGDYKVKPLIYRSGKKWLSVNSLSMICTRGFIYKSAWYALDLSSYQHFLKGFENSKDLVFNTVQFEKLQEKVFAAVVAPRLLMPEELQVQQIDLALTKSILFEESHHKFNRKAQCRVNITFNYDDLKFTIEDKRRGLLTDEGFVCRDVEAEEAAIAEIQNCDIRLHQGELLIPNDSIYSNLQDLSAKNWEVKVKGSPIRSQTSMKVKVKSGIDWLELDGAVSFGDEQISLYDLIDRIKENQNTITLNDGSLGYFREEDFQKLQGLLKLGKKTKDGYRFQNSQTFILDALLADQPEVSFDEAFQKARKKLNGFKGIGKKSPPKSLQGELRPYQKEGLAWLHFTREFGVGACLADDMGLGKTVQVISLLEHRRLDKKVKKPTLIILPTSLIFNWQREFEKFTPDMKVYVHVGAERRKDTASFKKHDVILTTYGLMRNDIEMLKDFSFDYAILDEGQAIKNATTASAKAARLIQADHRIIMSGTPIENHLGELWSLFEFLNPGMLGTASAFKNFNASVQDPATLEVFSKALRPMILRRKKEDVAKDLPAKTEQTLYCQMEDKQLKYYNKLRDAYRQELLGVGEAEFRKSKLKVLEALTRLRQAACHPGLIDTKKMKDGSAKLQMVIPQIAEVIEEGHKVLVFSQFTKFLGLVKTEFDKLKVSYEYLDGRTKNRQQKVDKFQQDPDCKLFLISLKAGGTGLNLTEAEYVYLLDPWWNPATEAQAIDRAHRIGQKRNVFAYRVIAKDSIEEKILELQESKKALADSILSGDNKSLRNLTKEDLEILFS